MNRYFLRGGLCLVLLSILLLLPAQAQEARTMTYGDVVRGSFSSDDPAPHTWQFTGDTREIVALNVRRIGGQFTPRLTLTTPDGNTLTPTGEQSDAHSQYVIFRQGLPRAGTYNVQIREDNTASDTLLNISEYTLELTQFGKRRAATDEGLRPLPDIGPATLPDYFTGDSRTDGDLGVELYGSVRVTQPDARTERYRYILRGSVTVDLNTANPISRGIPAISFTDNGVALQHAERGGDGVFFTDQNITALTHEQGYTSLTLENGQSFRLDFYRLQAVFAVNDRVAVITDTNQRILLDGQTFEFIRRGGLLGEGVNAEPVNLLRVDENEIETDLQVWHTLAYLAWDDEPRLRVLYGDDTRLISDRAQMDLYQRGNSFKPELDEPQTDTSYLDITWQRDDTPLPLAIDPEGMGDVRLEDNTLQVLPLDGRSLSEPLDGIAALLVEDAAVRFRRLNGSYRTSLLDTTDIETPAALPDSSSQSPFAEGFIPQEFNNTGIYLYDYHPDVLPYDALQPYNRVNGNFYYPVEDARVPSHTLELHWQRHYNSRAPESLTPAYMQQVRYRGGSMGQQWRHSYQYDLDLRYAPLGNVRLILPDGSIHRFQNSDSDPTRFRSRTLHAWQIERVNRVIGDWQATTADGTRYTFDRAGRLQRITDANDLALLFSPASTDADTGTSGGFYVTDPYGRRFEIATDADNRIISMQDVQGRTIEYTYSGSLLTDVDYIADDARATYGYSDTGLLNTIDDTASPYHPRIALGYDADRRVIEYIENPDASAAAPPRQTTLTYPEAGVVTETHRVNGEQHEHRWLHDSIFRLTEQQLPLEGWSKRYTYDTTTGRLSGYSPPNRATMSFTLNSSGYITSLRDPIYAGTDNYTFEYTSPDGYRQLLTRMAYPGQSNLRRTLEFTYDEANRLQQVTRPLFTLVDREDEQIRYTYDERGRLASRTMPGDIVGDGIDGEPVIYEYDAFGYLASVQQGDDPPLRFQHDIVGRLVQVTDKRGTVITLDWDTDREHIVRVSAGDFSREYDYDAVGNLVRFQEQERVEEYVYNGLNQVISYIDSIGRVTAYEYDEADNVLRVIQPDESTRVYTYNALNQLTSATDAGGLVTQYDTQLNPDANRVIQIVTNPAGEQRRYTYDALNRLRQVQYVDRNGTSSYTYNLNYDAPGNLTDIQEAHVPGGRTLALTYDVNGNVLSSSIDGTRTTYTYNAEHQLTGVTDPEDRTIQYAYDNTTVRVTAPDGTESLYQYDENNNLVRFVNALEQTYLYTYDAQNRLTSVQDPAANLTSYSYDANGNLTAITDPRDNRISLVYDEVDRLQQVEDAAGNRIAYEYDALDRLTGIDRPLGLSVDVTYDPQDNIIAVAFPRGREILYGRDNLGRISNRTDALGRITIYAYNTIGEVGRVINPLGNAASYGWSSSGRLLSYVNTAGHRYEYNADDIGRLRSINDLALEQNLAINLRLIYDDAGYITGIQEGSSQFIGSPRGINRTYEYDARGRIISYQEPEAATPWRFEYDALGQVIAVTRPDNVVTRYSYDAVGNITGITRAAGTESETVEQYEYDRAGNVTRYQAPDGTTVSVIYDENNRMTQRTETSPQDNDRTTFFSYNALGYLQEMTDPAGQRTRYQYDIFGNLERVERRLITGDDSDETGGIPIRYTYRYDEVDNLTAIQLPGGQEINLTYNVLDEQMRYVDAMDRVWAYTYDKAGNLSQVSDPAGSVLGYQYDNANRLTGIQYPTGASVDIRYDTSGNPEEFIQPATRTGDITQRENSRERVSYVLDRAGHLMRIEHIRSTIEFERDAMRRVTQRRAADGSITRYSYDPHGNLTRIQRSDETITMAYDSAGRMVSRSGSDGLTAYTYDEFGQLSRVETPDATVTYQYDAAGNLLVRDAGEYGRIEYTYDSLYRPVRVQMDNDTIEITYNENGWPTVHQYDNGLRTRYGYNDNGYIESITHTGPDGNRLDSFAYLYDSVGNISRITRGDLWSVLYSYDAAHQLTSERWLNPDNQAVYSVTYSYDNAGNRIEKLQQENLADVERTLYNYNNQNQLTEEIQNAVFSIEDRLFVPLMVLLVLPVMWWLGRRKIRVAMLFLPLIVLPMYQQPQEQPEPALLYEYDVHGNLSVMRYATGGEMRFSYDGANRLNATDGQTATGESVSTRIRYDSAGRVYEVDTGDVTYRYLYDAYGLMAIRNLSDGTVTTLYRLKEGGNVLRMATPEGIRWPLHDVSGTVRRLTDGSAELIGPASGGYNLNAFGEWIEPYGADNSYAQPQMPQPLYTGQLYLSRPDIYLTGVRAYLPTAGRFIQRDPVRHDPQGTLYTYAYNRPGVYTDPDGMVPVQAYEGLEAQPPDVQLLTDTPSPLLPDLPAPPAVHVLQAMENHRILQVAQTARSQINRITGEMAPSYCDFYMYLANPLPPDIQEEITRSGREMTRQFSVESGWYPPDQPDPRHPIDPFRVLNDAQHHLRQHGATQPMEGCNSPLTLPTRPNPLSATDALQQRTEFTGLLREVPMFGIMPEQLNEMKQQDTLPVADALPQVTTHTIAPGGYPDLPAPVNELIQQTHSFYRATRLPGLFVPDDGTIFSQVENQPGSIYRNVQRP